MYCLPIKMSSTVPSVANGPMQFPSSSSVDVPMNNHQQQFSHQFPVVHNQNHISPYSVFPLAQAPFEYGMPMPQTNALNPPYHSLQQVQENHYDDNMMELFDDSTWSNIYDEIAQALPSSSSPQPTVSLPPALHAHHGLCIHCGVGTASTYRYSCHECAIDVCINCATNNRTHHHPLQLCCMWFGNIISHLLILSSASTAIFVCLYVYIFSYIDLRKKLHCSRYVWLCAHFV